MHLTRFLVNTARRGARKLLASPQAMHAAVLSGFPRPEDHTRDDARTLWRLDQQQNRQVVLYIVSPTAPDLTHLVEQAGWPTSTEGWQSRPYDRLLGSLDKGQQWAFRLTANPSRTGRKTDTSPSSQRFGHVTAAQQTEWLTSRAERNGFTIASQGDGELNLVTYNRQVHRFNRNGSKGPVTLVTASYDGVLEVTDPALLRGVLTRGIGHARAYGCGLLTLAPVQGGS
ncbi:type I-E CRISPR-associated protein Cas6/Cse3/CasE [Micromonospora endophytica]|uniref:Type I-E CRISPR-associated protein Cas6/Cse3/CasE n=1 Tax=Micromonospora endophytica TaxID=515350 RepID=A0A2W2CC73_9ACTN|nr:type I-E CRISPR-associated protein Cas6/Cse3/CasE [Micromonospora endophytica]PZF97055.1 type I-E CRISPR-associated protein Cas6/Cse3/CasE [Micromonospora endophytica]RIW40976.1 type I-E CRISPR-associated protein Cas6/Cse3/CasE [Micromonospora endophytica]BCJ58921.1 type I-E CRISPR-associated protein Cas6/Cse3/CasE [Micromonospora endophytica]